MGQFTVDGNLVTSGKGNGITWIDDTYFTLTFLGKNYHGEIIKSDIENRFFTVKINQRTFEIRKTHPLDELIKSMGLDKQKVRKLHQLHSPMPGRILSYSVEVGQQVSEGTPLLTLEAMKMENVIKAEGEGVVKAITQPSESVVDKGTVLIEFE